MIKGKKIVAIPPGATIKEQIENIGMTQKELACRMDMSEKHISNLINGDVLLTMDTAIKLQAVLGLPAQFWCNLESIYRNRIALIEQEKQMDEELELLKKFPYKEMQDLGWVEKTNNRKSKIISLRRYFEVADLCCLDKPQLQSVYCRKLGSSTKSDYSKMVSVQRARIDSREMPVKAINISKLKKQIPHFRNMTTQNPEEFYEELVASLAECGIALVLLPQIKGSYLHGVSFIENKKIVIGLTLRGKDADKFWFTFFHELGHVLNDDLGNSECCDESEAKADEYARNTLIPIDSWEMFVETGNFTKKSVENFAKEVSIDPGIVVGRLQKESYLPYNKLNNLKTQYELSKA